MGLGGLVGCWKPSIAVSLTEFPFSGDSQLGRKMTENEIEIIIIIIIIIKT